jgi:hypothetical protein
MNPFCQSRDVLQATVSAPDVKTMEDPAHWEELLAAQDGAMWNQLPGPWTPAAPSGMTLRAMLCYPALYFILFSPRRSVDCTSTLIPHVHRRGLECCDHRRPDEHRRSAAELYRCPARLHRIPPSADPTQRVRVPLARGPHTVGPVVHDGPTVTPSRTRQHAYRRHGVRGGASCATPVGQCVGCAT